MNTRPRAALYSPELLALAVELADYPLDLDAACRGEARSRTCGSQIELSCGIDHNGILSSLGLRVSACAVGQAAAAIFAGHAVGRTASDIEAALSKIAAWLAGEGARPEWPRIGALEPALPHSARHGAILLPWAAALDALPKSDAAG